jgi:hypothetical protein
MFTKKTSQTQETNESKITAKTKEYLNAGSVQAKSTSAKEAFAGLDVKSERGLVSKTALSAILIAAAISVGLSFLPHPYGFVITYPMNLFVTYIHEGCHALMTLLTGGWVSGIGINPDTSGVTQSQGGLRLLIIPAGYIGSTVFGALLIRLMQRGVSSTKLLYANAAILGIITVATVFGTLTLIPVQGLNPFGAIFGAFLTALYWLMAKKLPKNGANIALAVTAVQCILGSLLKLHLVFQSSLNPWEKQDPNAMAQLTLIPAPVWSILWAITSLAALWWVLRPAAWKNSK